MEQLLKNSETKDNPYQDLGLEHLFEIRSGLQSEVKQIQKLIKDANEAIEARVAEAVSEKRRMYEKETGSVDVEVEGLEVKHDVPKKVEWLQRELAEVADELGAMGHDPHDIVAKKLSVNENVYKNLPEKVQWLLNAARVVKHGKTNIELKETK